MIERDKMIEEAASIAFHEHRRQRYNDKPYTVHLGDVAHVLEDFGFASPEWQSAAWLHDLLEDTHVSVKELQRIFGAWVSTIVWAVTGQKGVTREEHMAVIYEKIAMLPIAAVLKVADRIANLEAADAGSLHMVRMLRERDSFRTHVAELPSVPQAMRVRLAAAYKEAA